MKNALKALTLLFSFSACNFNQSAKKDISSGALLADMDFSNGKYALYIKHKEFGEFMVLDEEALKENRDKLIVNISLANYLPGEGDRSFGVILFKDNKLVTQKSGGVFTHFAIGNLADHAVPVKSQRIQGVKKRIQEKQDSIADQNNIFITYQSAFVPDNRAFRFRVYFPCIAVPVTRGKDSAGYERIITVNGIKHDKWIMESESLFDRQWGEKIERCIRDKAGTITDFEVSIAKSSMSNAYLLDKAGNDLKTPNKKTIYIKDYMYYSFTAYLMADKDNAEKLLALDYSDCMSEEDRNRPLLIAKMKALVKQSTQPHLDVDKGEIGLEGYKDNVTKYKALYEQEYSLTWLEVERNSKIIEIKNK
ncbi:hypothetical protein FKX85_11395 [Echinicola soli]|uniref:Lipoprotein n=1 Tax=Echinicola soli TaxID=2591634 RepID=A0A514CIF5_9BACT|nr:hypothetical protein [Echinicola soli]QDH79609.1 hypothetical protein FKX85_11395 [Echinicola soli]